MEEGHPERSLHFQRFSEAEMLERSAQFGDEIARRRSVRHFSSQSVPRAVLLKCIEAAATAPSGANKQPWTFVLITEPGLKRRIREAAEKEERAFYGGRAPQRWLDDLAAIGTNSDKPFLEDAPALIAVFAQTRGAEEDERHYYVNESVGIAVGFLLVALHHAGLATLTHTPSPMAFLSEVLERPSHERAYLLIPVGYPTADCRVPDIQRKPLSAVLAIRD